MLMKPMTAACLASLFVAPQAMAQPARVPPASPSGDYAAKAESVLVPYIKDRRFSGAVLVAKDGKVLFREAFGLADREWDVPVAPDSEFRLGSITKQFTATAIMQLAEQGKLNVDDPISKYVSVAPAAWSAITIRELLTHTSGIPSYTAIPGFFDEQARIDRAPEEIIKLTADKPLDFPPGTKFSYDNSGYVILGFIIEKVSGQSYADYLQTHIFGPLGMTHTGYDVSTDILPHRVSGYQHQNDAVKNAAFLSMTLPYAAGSLYSNVDDLLTWDQALYAARPVNAASLKAMFTDYGHGYGFGYGIQTQFGHREWAHGGGINGFATEIERYPDDHLTVIVLANFQDAPSNTIADELAGAYFGVAPPQAITLAPDLLDQYVGVYQIGEVASIRIGRDGDRLSIELSGQSQSPIYASDQRTFFSRIVNAQITFDAPASGKAPGFILHQGGVDQTARRINEAEAARLDEAMAVSAQEPLLSTAQRPVVKVDSHVLDGYVGAYRMTPSMVLTVTRDGDKLFAQATGQPLVELFALSDRQFFLTVADVQMTFQPDASGKAAAVVVHQNGADTSAPRIGP
jgi:D-alanyl-D-alanine carboxypeptidase